MCSTLLVNAWHYCERAQQRGMCTCACNSLRTLRKCARRDLDIYIEKNRAIETTM